MKGIDISKWNGAIDFAKVKRSGIQFVIMRAGYGKGQEDPRFKEYYKGATAAGLHVGAYWYSYAQSVADAEREAEACLSIIGAREFDFPIFYDVEEKEQFSKGKRFIGNIITAFCETLARNGRQPGMYLSTSYLNTLVPAAVKSRWPVWAAQYNKTCTYSGENLGVWQYSSKGKVNGISGDVDMDISYVDYPSIIAGGSTKIPTYKDGKVYTVLTEVKVREYPNGRIKKYSELTTNAKAHDKDKDGALDAGTKITCKGSMVNGGYVWVKCPSGWCAGYNIKKGKYYIK